MGSYRLWVLWVVALGLLLFASVGPSPNPADAQAQLRTDEVRVFEDAFASADVNDPAFVAEP